MLKYPLGFGMMRLYTELDDPSKVRMKEACEMVDTFIERGFTYFDTSYLYQGGHNEENVREVLVKRHTTTYNSRIKDCGMFEFAAEMKRQGKIRHFGFSYHDTQELLDRILTEHPETEFVQLIVNYYDWESPFVQSRKCYEVVRKHGKKVVIMEPVKGGLLAKLPRKIHDELEKINPEASDASYAMRFATDLDGVLCVLSGMNEMQQVIDNTDCVKDLKPLSEKEKELLDAYNSIMVQVNRGLSVQCENGYYRGLQFLAGRETGKTWIDGKIIDREGNDITELVREAEEYLIEHTFL